MSELPKPPIGPIPLCRGCKKRMNECEGKETCVGFEDAPEMSAHEILAMHVTNVSDVTGNVIRRAVNEYEALAGLRMEPLMFQLDAIRKEIAVLTDLVKQVAEAPVNGSSR